ncbi:hypothetical protein PN462_10345 [Spirulina sp. CS-785/01]|uniref:hypothetical protein n=1 Tax=Spirulina sp. CS-785/01 TaxID=3021716 RepID=UPI00232E8439|nr:hypothetical protein [Spirulina sp. CS-785/01]MDB9313498.1 hypothetical protein [Spirulina sp. CS-785/01]
MSQLTLQLTVDQIIELIQQLSPEEQQKIMAVLQNPWLKMAGKYKNDSQFEEMLNYIEEDRKQLKNEQENRGTRRIGNRSEFQGFEED